MAKKEERVPHIEMDIAETGETVILDFDRDSIKWAENRGFSPANIEEALQTKTEELFFFAFRKNHPKYSRQQTDKIIKDLGGLHTDIIARLGELYAQVINATIRSDGELGNEKVIVRL